MFSSDGLQSAGGCAQQIPDAKNARIIVVFFMDLLWCEGCSRELDLQFITSKRFLDAKLLQSFSANVNGWPQAGGTYSAITRSITLAQGMTSGLAVSSDCNAAAQSNPCTLRMRQNTGTA